ncbi:hypothetical protein [Cognatitamlana onchidii]|uniref:hypothetical protein n=1 Tax=Cognatitamlana onchidii TaxID=2562860 RepID=UPI0010A65579|nr:hypothetical protein [Algibacter onchidii]
MKTKQLFVLAAFVLMVFSLSSFKTETSIPNNLDFAEYQNGLIVYATYKGMDGTGYAFEKKAKNGKVVSFTFHHIEEAALKKYNLKSEALVGSLFKITFNKDDNFTEETHDDKNTITDLEKS